MEIPPSGKTPHGRFEISEEQMNERSGLVETPNAINSSLRPIIDTASSKYQKCLVSHQYGKEVNEELEYGTRLGGGEPDEASDALLKTAKKAPGILKMNVHYSVKRSGST